MIFLSSSGSALMPRWMTSNKELGRAFDSGKLMEAVDDYIPQPERPIDRTAVFDAD